MRRLEREQNHQKAYVDRHQQKQEDQFGISKAILVFQTKSGKMPGKLKLRWSGPFWILNVQDDTYQLENLQGDIDP
jgi:hypothetical protein